MNNKTYIIRSGRRKIGMVKEFTDTHGSFCSWRTHVHYLPGRGPMVGPDEPQKEGAAPTLDQAVDNLLVAWAGGGTAAGIRRMYEFVVKEET